MTPRKSNQSSSGTVLALVAMLFLSAGFIGLTAMVMPAALGFLMVLFAFFLFGSFHYIIWGWWFERSRLRDDADETDAPSE